MFIDKYLQSWTQRFSQLRIIVEHISTKLAVDFVSEAPSNCAATITAHHLHYDRNDLLANGIKPHYYCKPILKRSEDRQALIKAATSGSDKFFLGTDSAPHAKSQKESCVGCAGIYTSPCALSLYTEIFSEQKALQQLEAFASLNGAKFYQLEPNSNQVELINEPWNMPQHMPYGDEQLIPCAAGEQRQWQIKIKV